MAPSQHLPGSASLGSGDERVPIYFIRDRQNVIYIEFFQTQDMLFFSCRNSQSSMIGTPRTQHMYMLLLALYDTARDQENLWCTVEISFRFKYLNWLVESLSGASALIPIFSIVPCLLSAQCMLLMDEPWRPDRLGEGGAVY